MVFSMTTLSVTFLHHSLTADRRRHERSAAREITVASQTKVSGQGIDPARSAPQLAAPQTLALPRAGPKALQLSKNTKPYATFSSPNISKCPCPSNEGSSISATTRTGT